MYRSVITPSAERAIKKLPRAVREEIFRASAALESNPYSAEQLSGPLSFLRSLHVKVKNVAYRVAYEVDEEKQLIIVHLAHSRENFYEKLRRLF